MDMNREEFYGNIGNVVAAVNTPAFLFSWFLLTLPAMGATIRTMHDSGSSLLPATIGIKTVLKIAT